MNFDNGNVKYMVLNTMAILVLHLLLTLTMKYANIFCIWGLSL